MSTKPASKPETHLTPAQEPESGWETLKAPELFSFDEPGKTLVGKLVSIATVELNGKQVTQYLFRFHDQVFKVLATFDLAQKISRKYVGYLARIKYRGEDQSIKKKGNAMKVFDVQVKPDTESRHEDAPPITYEDIPF